MTYHLQWRCKTQEGRVSKQRSHTWSTVLLDITHTRTLYIHSQHYSFQHHTSTCPERCTEKGPLNQQRLCGIEGKRCRHLKRCSHCWGCRCFVGMPQEKKVPMTYNNTPQDTPRKPLMQNYLWKGCKSLPRTINTRTKQTFQCWDCTYPEGKMYMKSDQWWHRKSQLDKWYMMRGSGR